MKFSQVLLISGALKIVLSRFSDNNNSCIVSGCDDTICSEKQEPDTCPESPEFSCYATAVCEVQTDGKCGWTMSEDVEQCLYSVGQLPAKTVEEALKPCYRNGCDIQTCSSENKQENCGSVDYISDNCYNEAVCEAQIDGNCGFTLGDDAAQCFISQIGYIPQVFYPNPNSAYNAEYTGQIGATEYA